MKRRKLLFVYILLLFIVIIAMYFFHNFTAKKETILPRDFTEIKQEGILRIITEYSPTGYYFSGDTIQGFQYELSGAISQISGLQVEIHLEMSLSESLIALDHNACDVIARNIPVTSEMRENYLFTEPVVLNKQVLMQRTTEANNGTNPIRNQLNLAGKSIYVPQYSPAILRLQHLAHEIGDSIYIIEDEKYSSEQLAIMVAKGDIDYAVSDQQDAIVFKGNWPELDIETDISFTQLQAWLLRKDSPVLLDSLNNWLKQIRENGIYDEIYKRYYANSY